MNTEIAALKGYLSDLKMRRRDLELKIDANIKAAKALLATSIIKPIDMIDIDGAAVNLQEAVELKKERAKVMADIERIEQEIG